MTEAQARRGGREARRQARTSFQVRWLPPAERRIPLYEVLDEEQLERLHEAAMRVLEELGIEFRDDEALALWKQAGAEVSGQRVRIPRELLMGLVAKAPERFTIHARNPERNSTASGATERWRTCATCTSWPIWPRCCTTRAR
jgi:trimethylamine--corrinoid protein Co-methyltransferase